LHISNLYAGSYRFLLFDILNISFVFFLFYLIFNLSANSISGQTILIVEDDNNLSRGIAFSFEKEGFAVRCAETLSAGKDIFDQNTIDLVILDLNLPDRDGVDFCKAVAFQLL